MQEINKDSPIPLYFQISEIFRNKIENNAWKIGDIIPAELNLCEHFQVSRGTIRQAINSLIQEGYLTRKQGLGTFVGKPNNIWPVSNFYCSKQTDKSQKIKLKRKILLDKMVIPNERIRKIMNLKDSKEVFQIEGLLLNYNSPISFEIFYLLKDFFPNFNSEDLSNLAPYEVFMMKYHLHISEIHESFSLKKLDKKISDKLRLPKGDFALLVSRLSWSRGIIFEYRQSIIKTDKCNYTVKLI